MGVDVVGIAGICRISAFATGITSNSVVIEAFAVGSRNPSWQAARTDGGWQ